MKKTLILVFSLAIVLSLSGCGNIAEQAGDKVIEKAVGIVEDKLEEAGVDTDKLEEEVKKLEEELDATEIDDKKEDKEDESKETSDDKTKADQSNQGKTDLFSLDNSLTGIALIKACEPLLNNDPMNGEESFYAYSKLYSIDDETFNGDYTVKMYFSKGRKNERVEIVTDSVETTTTMIINGEEGKSYMIFGNGRGYKIPNFGMDNSENAKDMGFEYTLDDETISNLEKNLIEAKIVDLNGEKVLYIKDRGEVYEFDHVWLSLERNIAVRYEAYNGNDLMFSSELLEFESGGDYSEMFKEPTDVDWMSMSEMQEMFGDE